MIKTILGKVAMTPKGTWVETTNYMALDIVEHNGSSYVVLQSVAGVEPINDGVNYYLLASKGLQGQRGPKGDTGEQGPQGTGLNIIGKLNSVGELPSSGKAGDGYLINGMLYVWSSTTNVFEQAGNIQGPQGEPGSPGADGTPGMAATVKIGNVTTGAEDSPARVTNSGTSINAVFDFTIPRGATGAAGAAGKDGSPDTGEQIMEKINGLDEVVFSKYVVCGGGAGVATTSDMRFKYNITPLEGVLPMVLGADFFRYTWKDGKKVFAGSSAQYWEEYFPEFTHEMDDEARTKTLSYDMLGGVIALKALQEENAERRKETEELRREIAELKKLSGR